MGLKAPCPVCGCDYRNLGFLHIPAKTINSANDPCKLPGGSAKDGNVHSFEEKLLSRKF